MKPIILLAKLSYWPHCHASGRGSRGRMTLDAFVTVMPGYGPRRAGLMLNYRSTGTFSGKNLNFAA